ncbi:MAG: tetratricopeptide repeat protein [Candidatus Methanoperedens sp.]|nr:tetratricopeptide repeat protein [Candidatus Methanoperedens sp.]
MATASNIMLYRYSPENMDETILRKLFVGREKLLKSVLKEIEDAARKKTPRFILIVGPRGIGKSHFLVLLYHEIRNKLGSMLVPIKLREEEYSVYRASDLFLRILEEKKEDTKEILSLANEDEILHAAVEKLKLISKRDGKRFIIFIENLHELFKQLDLKELQKLRSIFQKNDFFSIVASAPMIFPGISEHDEPFYNFFQIQFLSEFSLDEIKDLIQKIAEAENNTKFLDEFEKYEPKIHGLAHLTGGSPRLVILFYEMIARGELENIEKAFLKIIDEHTPYYQEIFQLLTGQKRRIFDAVISSETPVTPKLISKETRLDLPTVTTQLRRLETDGYVISRPMGRYTKYEVRERLFRLWREMRQPLGRKRVSILLEFLQYWYTPEERKELFKMKFELLEAGKKNVLKDLCYVAETLSPEYKTEAYLKLTPKLIEFGEREEAAYEIQKLKEAATQIKDSELEGKIPLYEGNLLISERRYEEALKALNKAIEINLKDGYALSRKGAALINLGRNEEALEVFNKAIEINPKDGYALSRKGIALINLGKNKEALEVFNKAIEINPNDGFALSRKGAALGNLGRYEKALEVFNKAIEINPKDGYALSRKGLALINLGRNEEALEIFNKAIEINPKEGFALSRKGAALGNLGRHEEALEVFNKAIEINPKDGYALSRKGLALINLGKNEEALEIFNKAIEINPKEGFALSRKGLALINLGRNERALEVFNKAIEINPKNGYALSRKGAALGNLGRHEEALDVFNKAIEINLKDGYALSRKGAALGSLGRNEEALEVFNKAIEINPKDGYALSRKGDALISLSQNEEALDELNKAIKINPKDGFAFSNKGVALVNLGKYEESLDAFNKAIELNPKDEFALSRKGLSLVNLGRHEEALDTFNKAIKFNSNDDFAFSMKGIALVNLGRLEEALNAFNKAIELNPKDEFAFSNKGIALRNLGRNEEALDVFNKAIDLNLQDELVDIIFEICFNFALDELKAGNRGNATKFMKVVHDMSAKLKEDKVAMLMINFLKSAADSGEIQVVKSAVDDIIKIFGNKYEEYIKPIIKALEIIETKDIQKYYDLQIEEREIVADIVKKITKSDNLLPDEIKRRETRLTDYATT